MSYGDAEWWFLVNWYKKLGRLRTDAHQHGSSGGVKPDEPHDDLLQPARLFVIVDIDARQEDDA